MTIDDGTASSTDNRDQLPPCVASSWSLSSIRRRLFGIPAKATRFSTRGFEPTDPSLQRRLELVAETFVSGYHSAMLTTDPEKLARALDQTLLHQRGFAYEGAGMALALLDILTPWRRCRLAEFLDGPAASHSYLVHVGAGWACAQLHLSVDGLLARTDPLLGWLALDGYGFHSGFFNWPRYVARQQLPPNRLHGYQRQVFDQGLGRSLWFVKGARVPDIASTIKGFADERKADLWSGVGLAAAYAGGVEEAQLRELADRAGKHVPSLAQGVAFAAEARERAGNASEHTELAAITLCQRRPEELSLITWDTRQDLPETQDGAAYALWRQRIQQYFQ